jgi:hypothetical protein
MLRRRIGDDLFFAIFPVYAQAFAHGNATTEDFQAICEDVTGVDLDCFFQQWIYGDNYPIYYYSTKTIRRSGGRTGYNTYVHIDQVHDTEPQVFSSFLDFQFWFGAGYTIITEWIDQRSQDLVIHTGLEPDSIFFDPENWLLDYHHRESYTLHIISDSLKPALQGDEYYDTLIIIAANDEFIAEIIDGDLPPGISLDSTGGILSGGSFEVGEFNFTVRARDKITPEYTDEKEFTLIVTDAGYGPGDANLDGEVNVGDAVFLINYIFSGGPPPEYPNYADVNADCEVNVGDIVYLIAFIFNSGPIPQMGCVE